MSEVDQNDLDLELEQDVDVDADDGDPEYSDIELEAMDRGWKPEGVEGKRTLSAEEFLDRQPLYDELHKQKRANKKLAETQAALAAHLEQLRKERTEDKISELKALKRQALEDDEHDLVMEIDEKIIEIREKDQPIEVDTSETEAQFESWVEENSWYANDARMRRYADALGAELARNNGGQLTEQDLVNITAEVKDTFKDKFPSPRRNGSPVDGSRPQSRGRRAQAHSVKDLDPETRAIHDTLVNSGTMSSEEYIKDLEATGYFN